MAKVLCLIGGFVLGWLACIMQALYASKIKPISVDSNLQ